MGGKQAGRVVGVARYQKKLNSVDLCTQLPMLFHLLLLLLLVVVCAYRIKKEGTEAQNKIITKEKKKEISTKKR